jgi:hypothetical protein
MTPSSCRACGKDWGWNYQPPKVPRLLESELVRDDPKPPVAFTDARDIGAAAAVAAAGRKLAGAIFALPLLPFRTVEPDAVAYFPAESR